MACNLLHMSASRFTYPTCRWLPVFLGAEGKAMAENPEDAKTKEVLEATTSFLKSPGDDRRPRAGKERRRQNGATRPQAQAFQRQTKAPALAAGAAQHQAGQDAGARFGLSTT
jgi:hypothetical protein